MDTLKKMQLRYFALALLLALLSLVMVSSASALIPCEDCEHDTPPNARCAGICNGWWISFCADWFFYGCSGNFATSPATLSNSDAKELASPQAGEEPAAQIEAAEDLHSVEVSDGESRIHREVATPGMDINS